MILEFNKLVKTLQHDFNRRNSEIYSILGEFMVETKNFVKPYSKIIGGKIRPTKLNWTADDGWELKSVDMHESSRRPVLKLKIKETIDK